MPSGRGTFLSWVTDMVHVLLGGTGSLGQALAKVLLSTTNDKVRVLARGEHRLRRMESVFNNERLSFLVGDVRDLERLRLALRDAHRVYLMAALKHVKTCEYDVLEAVKTNVNGAANVVRACLDTGVEKAVLVSTDKAVEPTTAYGATKMCAERVFINGNSYSGKHGTIFSCVRYGNVLGSQGSVVEVWRRAKDQIAISNPDITRFWWTIEQAAEFVRKAIELSHPGDVLVPLMSSCTLGQLADMVAPHARRTQTDGYETEKPDEVLLAPYEVEKTTYVDGLPALRISYLHPSSERKWDGRQLSSADRIDAERVRRLVVGGVECRTGH